jgi:integrase
MHHKPFYYSKYLVMLTVEIVEVEKGGEETSRECPNCHSKRIVKDGIRQIIFGQIQRFLCKDCYSRFSDKSNIGLRANNGRQLCAGLKAKKLDSVTETQTVAGEKGKLVEYAWALKKRGLQESTIALRTFLLEQLMNKGADLNDVESVETVLATEKFTASKKALIVGAYRSFTKIFGIPWIPKRTKIQPKQPFIPLESELDQIIAVSGKSTAAFLQTLKDTGARTGEVAKIKWTDINEENWTVRINDPEKGSNSRTVKVSEKTIAMIKRLPKKHEPFIFNPNSRLYKNAITGIRKRLTQTLQNPRFLLIHMHTFRHWKATTEYAKTKDILYVMRMLGHRNIQNTLVYTQLVNLESDQYHSATAKTIEEARKLVEAGFAFVCDMEGVKLFSKRK